MKTRTTFQLLMDVINLGFDRDYALTIIDSALDEEFIFYVI